MAADISGRELSNGLMGILRVIYNYVEFLLLNILNIYIPYTISINNDEMQI